MLLLLLLLPVLLLQLLKYYSYCIFIEKYIYNKTNCHFSALQQNTHIPAQQLHHQLGLNLLACANYRMSQGLF